MEALEKDSRQELRSSERRAQVWHCQEYKSGVERDSAKAKKKIKIKN